MLSRLQRENISDLSDVIRGVETDGRAYSWRALERFILILNQAPQADEAAKKMMFEQALGELRIGVDIAAVHHAKVASSSLLSEDVRGLLLNEYRCARSNPNAVDGRLLQSIDRLLRNSLNWPLRARCALADVRLMLFPNAPPPTLATGNESDEPT